MFPYRRGKKRPKSGPPGRRGNDHRGPRRMGGVGYDLLNLMPSTTKALAQMLEATLTFLVDHRLYLQAIIAEAWTNPELLETYARPRLERADANLQRFLRQQIAAGRLRPFDAEVGARLVLGMMAALALPFIRGVRPPPGPEERRRLAENVVDLLLNGVGNPVEA